MTDRPERPLMVADSETELATRNFGAGHLDLRIAEEPVERQELLTMFLEIAQKLHVQPPALLQAIEFFSAIGDPMEFESTLIDFMDRMQPAAEVFDTMMGVGELDCPTFNCVVGEKYLARARRYEDPWIGVRRPTRHPLAG